MDLGPASALASTQRALITHPQLGSLGLTSRQTQGLVAKGLLLVVHRGVYRFAAVPSTWEQRIHGALLATEPDSFVAIRSALAWWGLPRRETHLVEIATTDERRVRLDGVRAHRTVDLPAADRRRHRGLPVTSIERSLFDAGRFLTAKQVGASLDHAVRDGLTTYERFQRRVQELGRSGRNGTMTARTVLADKGYGDGFGFEKAMRGLLRDAGFPAPAREYRVHPGNDRFRVDFAYPDAMVGIECDSTEWHELWYQRDYDLRRQNRIQNAGLHLLRYTVVRLRDDRDEVVDEIRDALTTRSGIGPGPAEIFPDSKRLQRSLRDHKT